METKDVIRELRTKAGLSQDELAEKLFVTRQAVSRWENGETVPNTETLKLLSKLFRVSINTLLGSPQQLVCQCCGMPLDDSTISAEPDGGSTRNTASGATRAASSSIQARSSSLTSALNTWQARHGRPSRYARTWKRSSPGSGTGKTIKSPPMAADIVSLRDGSEYNLCEPQIAARSFSLFKAPWKGTPECAAPAGGQTAPPGCSPQR